MMDGADDNTGRVGSKAGRRPGRTPRYGRTS